MTNYNKSFVEELNSLNWNDLIKLNDSMIEMLINWMIDAIDWAKTYDDYSIVCLKRRMMLKEWWQWVVIR